MRSNLFETRVIIVLVGIVMVFFLMFGGGGIFKQILTRRIPFSQVFTDIVIPKDAKTSAYTFKGKDRYAWARIEMSNADFAGFVIANDLGDKLEENSETVELASTDIFLLLDFRPDLREDWIKTTFHPKSGAKIENRVILIGQAYDENEGGILVYLFQAK